MKLTKLQRRTLKRIRLVCEKEDMCFHSKKVTRSVAKALADKGMIIGVRAHIAWSNAYRVGYMMLEAGYNALGFEIVDVMP